MPSSQTGPLGDAQKFSSYYPHGYIYRDIGQFSQVCRRELDHHPQCMAGRIGKR